ncbi:MAG: HNH endonuclease [Nanoarchaeota archaeon]
MIDDKEIQRRQKISQTLKGRTSWNKGLKNWRIISEETRRKIGLKHKGKKVIHTEETKRKISQTMKGKIPKNLNMLHLLPRNKEWKRKIGEAHKGMKHTEKTKRQISKKKRNPLRPIYIAIRECYKMTEWKKRIIKRDNYTCQWCGQYSGELNVDHIKPFTLILKENKIKTVEESLDCQELWNIDNGRTLCINCHKKTDTWGFRKIGK